MPYAPLRPAAAGPFGNTGKHSHDRAAPPTGSCGQWRHLLLLPRSFAVAQDDSGQRGYPIPILDPAPSGAPQPPATAPPRRLVVTANGVTYYSYRDPSLSLRMTADGGTPRSRSRSRSRSRPRSSTLDPSSHDSPAGHSKCHIFR